MGILTPAMQRLIRAQRLAYVASVRPDGSPNLSPRGSLMVWDADHLIWADLHSPRTTANLDRQPVVEINVVDPYARRGFRFRGEALRLTDPAELARSYELLSAEITDVPGRVRAVIRVRVRTATEIVSPGYDLGTTEDETRRYWRAYYERIDRGGEPETDNRA